MIVRYRQNVINMDNVVLFFKPTYQEKDPYSISFNCGMGESGTFFCLDFSTKEDRDKAFDDILSGLIRKYSYVQVGVQDD